MSWVAECGRQWIYEFHIPPYVRAVGAGFDAEAFADRIVRAHINSVVLFSKCVYGLSYYPTRVGTVHPGLQGDLFGAQLAALQRRDVRVWAYHGTAWDNHAHDANPEWRQVLADGSPATRIAGHEVVWRSVCLNSPYVAERLYPQVAEILERYPVDGMWFDMNVFMDGACFCRFCRQAMAVEGVDPGDLVGHQRFNGRSIERFVQRTTAFVKRLRPEVQVTYNNLTRIGSRVFVPHLDLHEIESLPFFWGFLYLPLYQRYVRTLGVPVRGITGRYHENWGDVGMLKSLAQLQYECATMLANGATCDIGDSLPPDASLDPATFDLIEQTYAWVAEREPWCLGAESVPHVALLAETQVGDYTGIGRPSNHLWGAAKALIEGGFHFDVVDDQADLTPYKAVVLVDHQRLAPELAERLRAYVVAGGRLLATHATSLQDNGEGPDLALGDLFGVRYRGRSPFKVDFLRPTDPRLGRGLPAMDIVVQGGFLDVELLPGARSLARARHPLTDRQFSHAPYAPPDPAGDGWGDAVVLNAVGAGKVAYVAAPLFAAFFEHDYHDHRKLMVNLLDLLLGDDRLLRVGAGPSVEVTLMRQGERLIVHLVNYHAERRGGSQGTIEEIPPRFDIPVRVIAPERLSRVYLAPSGEELAYEREGRFVRLVVPRLDLHQMVVLEQGQREEQP